MFRLISLYLTSTLAFASASTESYIIALKQHNVALLENLLLQVSDPYSESYGEYLHQDVISSIVSPPAIEVQPLIEYLTKDVNTLSVVNYGDTLVVERTVNKDMKKQWTKADLPQDSSDAVSFILPRKRTKHKVRRTILTKKDTVSSDDGFFARETAVRLYNIPDVKIDTPSSVASIEYQSNQGFGLDDLVYSQKANQEALNPVSNDHLVGPNDGLDVESELDVQMMSQLAPSPTELWFWDSPDWLYGFAVDFFARKTVPDVISMSYGWAEYDQCTIVACDGNMTSEKFVKRVNTEYVKIGLRGVTILVSSGDAGAPGRDNEGCDESNPMNPTFPGSSPWILSVGATFMESSNTCSLNVPTSPLCKNNQCAEGIVERSVSNDYVGWTAGGGFELYYGTRPKWQQTAVDTYLKSGVKLPANTSSYNGAGRAYPDVSAIGHACPTYIGSDQPQSVDGTSCSSPVFAGIIAVLNGYQMSHGRPKLGFVNPLLYKMWADEPDTFNDIVNGHNWCTEAGCCPGNLTDGSAFGFSATKGYDPVTGLGTPNVGKMLEWLNKFFE